ncbi:MAG: NEW3 domain-containing protein [Xanthobacteraceae bacterium]|jgi:uncharacterized membrane protein
MRRLVLSVCAVIVGLSAVPLRAEETPKDIKGLYLLTDYPAVTVRPGTTSTISLRLQNYNLPPERLELSVSGVPTGWTATLLGGGQPVAAAMAATNSSASLQLRLDVPANAPMGTQNLTIAAHGKSMNADLPVAVTLAKDLPAKLTVTPQLPELRGTAKSSFEYQISIKNDSGKRLTVALAADAPRNFETSFTENFGSQELNAVPVDAGQSKDVKLKVRPPNTIGAGRYPVVMRATAEDATAKADVALEVTGQPKLDIAGRDGLVSARAEAGKEATIPVLITNSGTAPADQIELSGSGPSGWKINFEPKQIERIAPGQNQEVQALVTPAAKAIAGDYVSTVRATSRGESASSNFRITVTTSMIWGVYGVGIIGVALLVMVGAVARFGRR